MRLEALLRRLGPARRARAGLRLAIDSDAVTATRNGQAVGRCPLGPATGAAPAGVAGRVDEHALASALRAVLAQAAMAAGVPGAAAGPVGAVAASAADEPIDVRIAAPWSRLFLVPWVAELNAATRWETFAASRFEQRYGEAAQRWQFRVVPEPPPRDRLAVALPAAWVACIGAACGTRLRSLRVAALDDLGALLAREPRFSGCAVEIDAHHGAVFVFVDGRLARVRTRRFGQRDELAAAVHAEWAAAGADDRTPTLAVGGPGAGAAAGGGTTEAAGEAAAGRAAAAADALAAALGWPSVTVL
jgi:hypothetical protein